MRWASAVSDKHGLDEAVAACAAAVNQQLEGAAPDLLVVFVSPDFAMDFERVPALLREHIPSGLLLGCSANGVIGGGHEVEARPGFSLTAASLPGATITPFYLDDFRLPDLDARPQDWETLVGSTRENSPQFVIISDPYSLRVDELLLGLDFAFPDSPKVGGLASGGNRPGANALYLDQAVYHNGGVGVALSGNVQVDTVVAQGCRPIGEPMRVTKCDRNVLIELDGRPPVEVLQELYSRASDHDQAMFRNSLHLGIVMDELQEEYRLGDFLIRNVMGIDREHGAHALVIGAGLREHQTVQFHLRDAATASEDLRSMLSQYLAEHNPALAQGALLFQCLGRGSYLYGRPDHDTDLFREHLGPVPLGGFFCNGEIGQVSGATYLHGYTSSFGIFRPVSPE